MKTVVFNIKVSPRPLPVSGRRFRPGDRVRIKEFGCLTCYAKEHPGVVARISEIGQLYNDWDGNLVQGEDYWYLLFDCPSWHSWHRNDGFFGGPCAWDSDLEPA